MFKNKSSIYERDSLGRHALAGEVGKGVESMASHVLSGEVGIGVESMFISMFTSRAEIS